MSADDTLKLVEQLGIRLARYRDKHAGASPKWVEVNPIAFPTLLSQLDLSAAGSDLGIPTLDGVALRAASSSNAALFTLVDP